MGLVTNAESLGERMLTIPEVAEYLIVSKDTVRRMISRGDLKAYRYGKSIRIHPRDVAKAGRPVTTFRRSTR